MFTIDDDNDLWGLWIDEYTCMYLMNWWTNRAIKLEYWSD